MRIPGKVNATPSCEYIGISAEGPALAIAIRLDFRIKSLAKSMALRREVKLNPEDLVSQATAARMRGVTKQAIEGLIKRGRLTPVVIDDHTFLLKKEVENYTPGVGGRPKTKTASKRTRAALERDPVKRTTQRRKQSRRK